MRRSRFMWPSSRVTPDGVFLSSSTHFPTASAVGYVVTSLGDSQQHRISPLPNGALDVSLRRIALHSSGSGGDSLRREPEGEVKHVRRAEVWLWESIFGDFGDSLDGRGCILS